MAKRGSFWNKWDLHLHSPKAFLANAYNGCSTEDFVKAIEDAGIKAVGLTNYFRFDEDELGYIKQQLNNKGIVIFPNLEFRTQPPNKENDEMHVHIIFSDTTQLVKIQGFLGRLKTVDDKYCKDLTQQEIATTSVSYDTLKTTLENDKEIKHFEDYLLAACPRGDGNYRPGSNDDGRGNKFAVVIDKKSDILFGKAEDSGFFLDTNRYDGALSKPVVCCSDAHSLEKIGSMSTWIKADLTFEGLKQILWEPKDRVKIQERNPSDTKSGRIVIDRLDYKDPNGNEQEILLNEDLNSIIGIRGSGKSTLLKNIACIVDAVQFEEKDKIDRLYKLDSFRVTWGDGKEGGGTEESPKSVFYIPQNYLSLLAYDETGRAEARDEFLTKLLKKNIKFANAIRAYDDFVSDNKVRIEGLIEKLLKENGILSEAKMQFRKQGSRKEIVDEIKTKNEDIKKYKGTDGQALTEEDVKSYTQAKQQITDSNKAISILEQDKSILTGLLESGADVYIANQEITRLSSQRQLALRTEFLKKSKENLSELIKNEVGKIDSEIKAQNMTITGNQQVLHKFGGRIRANKALETLTKELSQLQQILKTIDELEKIIAQATTNKAEAITGLVDAYTAFDIQQNTIFETIEFIEDFSFLQIDIVTNYDIADLKRFVERNINTVATSPLLTNGDKDVRKLLSDSPEKLTVETIRKCINKLVDGNIKLKVEAEEVGQVLSQFLKDRYEIDFLNSVKTKEDSILFKNMTGGQKAIAMLELVFRFDDERYPILIDQPEDDLDVSGVATDLVNFIKTEKNKRQIIVVSHNGSLVVCADTEDVIVSECVKLADNKYDFSYNTGAIENPEIRDQIIKVLEGGKEALKQRARKLNFKHEI